VIDEPGRLGATDRDLPARSMALVRAFGHTRDRATSFGMLAAVLTTVGLIVVSVATDRVPVVVAPFVYGAAASIVGVIIARLELPGRWLRAWEAYSWLGRRELDRMRAQTAMDMPNRVEDMEAFLRTTPPSPVMRLPRAELLAFLGRFDEARRELTTVAADTPEVRLQVAGLEQYLDWLDRGEVELDALRAVVASAPAGTDLRREGDVVVATAEARARVVAGDPAWYEPLVAVRDELGAAARRVVWRDTWLPRAGLFFAVGFVGGILAALLTGLL
jgi:hypothetical protein